MIKISVVVPIYNSKEYINRCIDSLINQKNFKDYEIILIDDGSCDGSEKICDEYVQNYKNIKVFHKRNEGVSKARNKGIVEAKGEYITFVDSDDYVNEYMLYNFSKAIDKLYSDIIFCGYNNIFVKKNKKIALNACKFDNINLSEFLDKYFSNYYCKYLIHGPYNKIYKSSIIKNNYIKFDESLKICEDVIFVIDCLNKSKTLSSIEGCYYNYMQNGTNDTLLRKYSENEIEANWKLYYRFKRLLEQNNLKSENIKLVKADFINRFIICLKKMFLKSGYSNAKMIDEVNHYILDERNLNFENIKYKSNILNKLIYLGIKYKLKNFTYILLKLYVFLKQSSL